MPFWKGPTRAEEHHIRHDHEVAVIAAVRAEVLVRDAYRCRLCGRRVGISDAEMHEIRPRSLTRGLPPEERFNTVNCLILCSRCHRDVTEHRVWIVCADPLLGANGRVWMQKERPVSYGDPSATH